MGFLFESPKVQYQRPPEAYPGLDKLGAQLIQTYADLISGKLRARPYQGYLSMLNPAMLGPSSEQYWKPFGPGPSLLQPGQPTPDTGGGGNNPPAWGQGGKGQQPSQNQVGGERLGQYGEFKPGAEGQSLFGRESALVKAIEHIFKGYGERAFPTEGGGASISPEAAGQWTLDIGKTMDVPETGKVETQTPDSIINDILNQIENAGPNAPAQLTP